MFNYDQPFLAGQPRGSARRPFENYYQCYSMAMVNKSHLDDGDKILLPPSALDVLSRMHVDFPMLFEVRNEALGRHTHCGVIEFVADEGKCHLPYFMMQNLMIDEGSIIAIKNLSLPKASYLKVRAQSVDFLEISNPRAVLEFTLRKYTCVTEGDVIVLNHAGKRFCMDVLEVKPNGAASIVETDVEIDFAEPVGYQDSEYGRQERERKQSRDFGGEAGSGNGMKPATLQRARSDSVAEDANTPKFVPFAGAGKRIDGKLTATGSANATASVNTTTSVSVATTSTSSGGLKIGSSSTTATSSSTVAATSATSTAVPTPTGYQSKIGDKFSKKKVTTSAFTGTGNKLT